MRLTCPNCNAQYEVDDAVIPRAGRDVQCSSCGHTWFQYPKEIALEMRAAELEPDDDDEDTLTATGLTTQTAPRIDKTVLDVLREEAERELSERQRDRAGLETQGDLGLTRPARARSPETVPGDAPDPDAGPAPPRRRNLLPDIEELTSTLEPDGAEAGADELPALTPEAEARGFRQGVSVVMLIAAALVALYVFAPLIAGYVPALRGVLTTYVAAIDSMRAAVAQTLRGVLGL